MSEFLDLAHLSPRAVYPLDEHFRGVRPDGQELGFTNSSMTLDGRPFFAISGEVHYARVARDQWEDTILKCKAGGLNIISTYVIWIVHEEIRGRFRFDGNRDLRAFLELCRRHGMYVILRIGPFVHGEMRNGGLPDWLYGMPFDTRSCDPEYYRYVRRFYREIHRQADGLYYAQGGCIIGTQIENEYMHSSAAWEMTTGVSGEYIPGGDGGDRHMLDLYAIAREEGIVTPFYTATAWGGARTPTEVMLPLWGGYAYRPWLFYREDGVHPLTEEYLYRDCHNDAVPATGDFTPRYAPESRPYSCCEMMGGMTVSYRHRFRLPMQSVDALANAKLGSGCNFLGYYMYRGGTNPTGERTMFLNEAQVPKRSYDYQAALGEYGLPNRSYFRLRALHALCRSFRTLLAQAHTVLPERMKTITPADPALRWCVRAAGDSGFLFLQNFQDHAERPDIRGVQITLGLPSGTLRFPELSIAGGENAVLPFGVTLDGVRLTAASAQPIAGLKDAEGAVWFFFAPEGMTPVYCFPAGSAADGCPAEEAEGMLLCRPAADGSCFTLRQGGARVRIVTLTRAQAERFVTLEIRGREIAFLADGALTWDGQTLRMELTQTRHTLLSFPPLGPESAPDGARPAREGVFSGWTFPGVPAPVPIPWRQTGASRYVLDIPQASLRGHRMTLLSALYRGDIAQLFVDGELIADNFCNGERWLARLDDCAEALAHAPLTLSVTPRRINARLQTSAMAGQQEQYDALEASLDEAELRFVDDRKIPL